MKKIKKENKKEVKSWQKMLIDLEEKINLYFGEKAPQLPEKVKEFLVKVTPYLMVISVIFAIPGILISLGLGAVLSPIGVFAGMTTGFHFSLALVVSIIVWVLNIMALPGLFKGKMTAWRLMFYVTLINAVYSLVNFALGSLVIGTTISWYFWFQIRKYYK